ncbi:MAG: outer membrane beta-barrel protein [Deltaproteobacteria bacterium]|nr:outer membrane beta-barrel protein [Deltaproteobacteria bacterium]
MIRKLLPFALCLSLILFLSLAVDAQAQQGGKLKVGRLTIIPSLGLQEEYNDNIYYASGIPNNPTELEESDWITHVMPGILFDYTLDGRGSVWLGYQGDLAYYNDNDNNDWKNHRAFFGLDYQAPSGLIVGIDNTYVDTSDPLGSDNQYKLGLPQTDRWSNALRTRLGWNFSDRFKVLGYYNYYKQDYDLLTDYSQDYDYNEGGLGLQMKVMPKTWAFVRYLYGSRDYYTHPAGFGVNESNDADFEWHRAEAGLTWDTGAKWRGELNLGYQWKSYENALDPRGLLYDDRDTWVAATQVSYEATSTTTLIFRLGRAVRDTGGDSNEYYDDTGVGIGLTQILFTKFTLNAGAGYSKNEYNLPLVNPRDQDNYLFNVGLDYAIQDWLTAGIGYDYMRKDSNYNTDEYKVNRFMVTLRAAY